MLLLVMEGSLGDKCRNYKSYGTSLNVMLDKCMDSQSMTEKKWNNLTYCITGVQLGLGVRVEQGILR